MRNVENILEIAKYSPDYMGFIFYPKSSRYVGELNAVSLQQIPSDIKKTGVFVNEDPEKVQDIAYRYDLDMIQLHGHESVNDCKTLKLYGFKVIKAFGIDNCFDFSKLRVYLPVCDFFLFDTRSDQYGGTGTKFNREKLKEYIHKKPFFLSGGIDFDEAEAILSMRHPALHAVDINSRFETSPGIKNADMAGRFINTIRAGNIGQQMKRGNCIVPFDH